MVQAWSRLGATRDGPDLEISLEGRMYRVGEQLDVKEEGEMLADRCWHRVPHRLQLTCCPDCSHVKATGERSPPQLTHMAVGWDISSLPSQPLHRTGYNMAAGFPQSEQIRELRECIPRCKRQSFHNLILEVICHHFCPILFVRNKSLSAAHTQREEVT